MFSKATGMGMKKPPWGGWCVVLGLWARLCSCQSVELDLSKREKFLSLMEGYSQAFFTFLPEEHYFASLASEDALVYDVIQGSFLKHEG
jgi:hypothetical protein